MRSICILHFMWSSALLAQNISINTTGDAANTLNMLEILQISNTANSVGLSAEHSGAQSGGNRGYALRAIKTGATGINVAGYFSATGGGSNYAILVPSGGGNIGLGTITPASLLHVAGNAQIGTASSVTGQLRFHHASSANATTFQSGNATSAVTYTLPTADGSSGQALTTNGSGSLSWGTPSSVSPATTCSFFEDFLTYRSYSNTDPYVLGSVGWIARMLPSGGFIPDVIASGNANHPGVFRLRSSGTSGHTVDIGDLMTGNSTFTYEANIQESNISGASASVTEYNRRVGMMPASTYTEPANGIYFRTLANGNWATVTRASSTETVNVSAVTPAASTWRKLKIVSTGTSIEFYIDGSLVSTHTTNIPTTYLSPSASIQGIGASSAGILFIDWITFNFSVTR